MPRINIYLDEETMKLLNNLSKEDGLKTSQYLSKLINSTVLKNEKERGEIKETLDSILKSQRENDKMITALLESLNTYYKLFASDDTTASQFFPIDESPHPWTRKAFEVAESKIRSARYSKLMKKAEYL